MLAHRAIRFFAFLAIAAGMGMSAAAANTLKGSAATAEAQKAARQLSKVNTLAADFDILTPSGTNQGKIFVDRPNESIRVEFAPPLGHLVLVNGPRVQFFGGDGTEIETATSGTPFAFLLDPEGALAGGVEVLQVVKKNTQTTLALAERGKKKDGQIILTFRGSGAWRLVQWGMFGEDGSFSQTKLRNVRTGASLDNALFQAPEKDETPE